MTANSDMTAAALTAQADHAAPALADCFTPRPHSGPGPLSALPAGQCLILAGKNGHGTGKTQLAAHLARTWLRETEGGHLIWLDATSRDSVLSGYVRAAHPVHAANPANPASPYTAEVIARRFLDDLAQVSTPWLVVLDGLTDPAVVDGTWPAIPHPVGRVLVTAKSSTAVPAIGSAKVATIGPFSSHEALAYLMARLSADPDQRLGAVDLVDELGCDPRALAQASAAIAISGLNCRDYLDLYLKRREELAATAPEAVTWTLAMECADELTAGGAPRACLVVAALLGAQGIPEEVFAARDITEFVAAATRSAGTADVVGQVRAALGSLQSAGVIQADNGLLLVSKTVRDAVLGTTPTDLRVAAATAAAGALIAVWPPDATGAANPGTALACTLRACTNSLNSAAADALWSGTTSAYQVLFRAGQSLDAQRLTGPAVGHWRGVAAAAERGLGVAHEDAQQATTRLANAALAAGLGTEAVTLYHRVLDTQAHYLGADDLRTVVAQADFGIALLANGQPAEAIPVLEQVLATIERLGSASPVDTLLIQDSLAAACQAAGRYKDAIRLTERILTERERRQGPDHPDAIRTRCRLARACLDAGRAKEAIAHGNRALEGAERVLGPDSRDTIDAVTVLANAYHANRKVRDAIALYERALADRERTQGADHPDTIGVRGNLASAYHSAGRLPSALDLYERTRADCQRVLGPAHPDTLAAQANLAHAYYAMGRFAEARALLTSTLADCERHLAPGDPLTEAVRDSLTAMATA